MEDHTDLVSTQYFLLWIYARIYHVVEARSAVPPTCGQAYFRSYGRLVGDHPAYA
jgi:hypothetical protein